MSGTGNLDGHLGEGMEVKGTLRFEGAVRIDGRFVGKIVSPAALILGPSAFVDGEIEVSQLAVHGALKGSAKVSERTTIHATGKVEADLDTGRLAIESGAYFQGRCATSGQATAPAGGAPGNVASPEKKTDDGT